MERSKLVEFLEGNNEFNAKFLSGGRNFYQLSSHPFNMDSLDSHEHVSDDIVTPVDKATGQTKSLVQRGEGSDGGQTGVGAHLPSTSKTGRAARNQKGRGKGKGKTTQKGKGKGKTRNQKGGKVTKQKGGKSKKKKSKKYTASFPSRKLMKGQLQNIFEEQ